MKSQLPVLSYPIPQEPWATVAIDLLKLPLTPAGHQYLLLAIDQFSRFSVLVPLKNLSAETQATALIDEVYFKFNTLKVLLSDNGTEFNNQILQKVWRHFEIRKCYVVAYHPASSNMVERQQEDYATTSFFDWRCFFLLA